MPSNWMTKFPAATTIRPGPGAVWIATLTSAATGRTARGYRRRSRTVGIQPAVSSNAGRSRHRGGVGSRRCRRRWPRPRRRSCRRAGPPPRWRRRHCCRRRRRRDRRGRASPPCPVERRVEAAVRVEPDDREIPVTEGPRGGADDDELAVGLARDRPINGVRPAHRVERGRVLPPVPKVGSSVASRSRRSSDSRPIVRWRSGRRGALPRMQALIVSCVISWPSWELSRVKAKDETGSLGGESPTRSHPQFDSTRITARARRSGSGLGLCESFPIEVERPLRLFPGFSPTLTSGVIAHWT